MTTVRQVREIRPSPPMHWVGDGFPVRTLFSYNESPELISPFLLLDHAAPRLFPPSPVQRGVGEHPHRGFETVTLIYQGEVSHRDSSGAGGTIGPGDVQWMTAAAGVVHEEKHSAEFSRSGGMVEMVQLWVNLPAREKLSRPRYQDLRDAAFPRVRLGDGGAAGSARVIAGVFEGASGPARTVTTLSVIDISLTANRTHDFAIADGHNAMLLVRRGTIEAGSAVATVGSLLLFEPRGEVIRLRATEDSEVLWLSGEPIAEPVVGYGPFVMNTQDEIRAAFSDYENGRMGHLE